MVVQAHPTGAAEVERCGGVAVLSAQQFSNLPGLPAAVTELLRKYFLHATQNDDLDGAFAAQPAPFTF